MGSSLPPWNCDVWVFFLKGAFGATFFVDFFLASLLALRGCQLKTMAKLSLTFCTGGTGAPLSPYPWENVRGGDLLPSQYLCTSVILCFLTSHVLNEGSSVTQFMGRYSLLHLPKITRVHNSVMSYSCTASGREGRGQQRKGIAAGSSGTLWTRALLARCLEGWEQSSTSWNWCHSVTEESSPWHAEKPAINIHFLLFYLGTRYQDPFIMKSSHLFNFHLNFLLKPGVIHWPPVLCCVYSRRFLSLVMIFTGKYIYTHMCVYIHIR